MGVGGGIFDADTASASSGLVFLDGSASGTQALGILSLPRGFASNSEIGVETWPNPRDWTPYQIDTAIPPISVPTTNNQLRVVQGATGGRHTPTVQSTGDMELLVSSGQNGVRQSNQVTISLVSSAFTLAGLGVRGDFDA